MNRLIGIVLGTIGGSIIGFYGGYPALFGELILISGLTIIHIKD